MTETEARDEDRKKEERRDKVEKIITLFERNKKEISRSREIQFPNGQLGHQMDITIQGLTLKIQYMRDGMARIRACDNTDCTDYIEVVSHWHLDRILVLLNGSVLKVDKALDKLLDGVIST